MSKYTELPDDMFKPSDWRGYWTNTQKIIWEMGTLGSGLIYVVPENYNFDVSIPWWATWVIDPDDSRFMRAAALHDHMLENLWDRPTAGAVFNQALKADGVSTIKRLVMFLGVSLFKWR